MQANTRIMRVGRRAALGALGALVMTGCPSPRRNPVSSVREKMAEHVARGDAPGIVYLVSRGSDVHVEALGALRRDTIFRISSMTKPIAAAGAMVLVDEGKLRLDEPIDRLLPELANRRVLARPDGPLDDTVPAKRPIMVKDLLTFCMGFGVIWGPQDAHPIQRAAHALELGAFGPPHPAKVPAPDEWLRRFATLPLMHQPGERWMYNTSAEVLGVLVARAAGKPLDVFLRERLFEPLGMKDTGFSVEAGERARLPTSYFANPATGALEINDPPDGEWSRPPAFPSAGAGLVSTIADHFAFAKMLLDRGVYAGRRVLSEAQVRAMTTDQLTPAQKVEGSLAPGFWDTRGWGFGMAVITKASALSQAGAYGWDGGLGTSWYSDPKRGTVGILMTQRGEYPYFSALYRDFWSSVSRA